MPIFIESNKRKRIAFCTRGEFTRKLNTMKEREKEKKEISTRFGSTVEPMCLTIRHIQSRGYVTVIILDVAVLDKCSRTRCSRTRWSHTRWSRTQCSHSTR